MRTHAERRILLVDDNAAFRHALALVLVEEGVGECWEAAAREEALAVMADEPTDLALVDLSITSEETVQLVSELSARNIPVLVCSECEEPSYVSQALAAGARGYITKGEAPRELARAVREGEVYDIRRTSEMPQRGLFGSGGKVALNPPQLNTPCPCAPSRQVASGSLRSSGPAEIFADVSSN